MNEYSLQTLVKQRSVPRSGFAEPPAVKEPKLEEEAEYEAFSFGRVGKRAELMLEVCLNDGFRKCSPYIDLKGIETMDPDKGFEIEFPDIKFTVTGQNLITCYRYLKQHRLESIRESARAETMQASESAPVIHSIKMHKLNGSKLRSTVR